MVLVGGVQVRDQVRVKGVRNLRRDVVTVFGVYAGI